MTHRLLLDGGERADVLRSLCRLVDSYADGVGDAPVMPTLNRQEIQAIVRSFDFATPLAGGEALARAFELMTAGQVHAAHPRYFGLFNPASTTMSIAADALVAALNPQLATASHAPFAVEAEAHLVRTFAERFGFPPSASSGTFTSGGAEANATALALALHRAFPEVATKGLRALPGAPTIYASAEAHHSLEKAARVAGLGSDAVRRVNVDASLRLRVASLREKLASDRRAGALPFLVVATCGTTSAGAIDPLVAIAAVAAKENLWLHVDAAWGGLAAFVPSLRPSVVGIDQADSITFDAHKSLSVAMGAGMLLTRHDGALAAALGVHAEYMPASKGKGGGAGDPYASSLQWSRRFIGLKLWLSLAVAGWSGYEGALRRFVTLGERLKERLVCRGFRLRNDTPLPIACFVDGEREDGASGRYLDALARFVAEHAHAWISMTRIGPSGERVLRACITSLRTTDDDVDALVDALVDARARIPRA